MARINLAIYTVSAFTFNARPTAVRNSFIFELFGLLILLNLWP